MRNLSPQNRSPSNGVNDLMQAYSNFIEMLEKAGKPYFVLTAGGGKIICVPSLAGRLYFSYSNNVIHRVDAEKIANPANEIGKYNNYGGMNIWPAPEGGELGWAYTAKGEWHIQDGVNEVPFNILDKEKDSCLIERNTTIVNRKKIEINVTMKREARIEALSQPHTEAAFKITVSDSFTCSHHDDILIAPWTLEQFDAHDATVSFCIVDNPKESINFDYYEHPQERIVYKEGYFIYRTDGVKAGQIGIKKSAAPKALGMLDARNNFLVVRKIGGDYSKLDYFNIADNEQKQGPYSAADVFSIFNSPQELSFLELETIGGYLETGGKPVPQPLVSESYYFFGKQTQLISVIQNIFNIDFSS